MPSTSQRAARPRPAPGTLLHPSPGTPGWGSVPDDSAAASPPRQTCPEATTGPRPRRTLRPRPSPGPAPEHSGPAGPMELGPAGEVVDVGPGHLDRHGQVLAGIHQDMDSAALPQHLAVLDLEPGPRKATGPVFDLADLAPSPIRVPGTRDEEGPLDGDDVEIGEAFLAKGLDQPGQQVVRRVQGAAGQQLASTGFPGDGVEAEEPVSSRVVSKGGGEVRGGSIPGRES